MKIKSYFILILLVFVLPKLHAFVVRDTTEAWMDSIIAEGVRKIGEAEAWKTTQHSLPQQDVLGNTYGSSYIIIDAADWAPQLNANTFYYDRNTLGTYQPMVGVSMDDTINAFNLHYLEHPEYVAYYNIVIHNFPFELRKDVSTIQSHQGQSLFTQLQQLGAIDNEDYSVATSKVYTIIHNICIAAQTSFGIDDVVCYGCANMLGQYGNQNQMRASFCAEWVDCQGIDTSLAWIRQLCQIPKLLSNPYAVYPSLRSRNEQVSISIRNFIECNQYNHCRADASVFTNFYARWLFSKLAQSATIDKQKLMSTCMTLNQLTAEMAWSVITADYENTYTVYNTQSLGLMTYRNATLDTITSLVYSIKRGADLLKGNTTVSRDTALYYGRLLYRIPSYMTSIPTTRRIALMKTVTSSTCSDITSTVEFADYQNHCERVCKALYTYVSESEIKPFMDQLKSTKVIWDVTHRIDNSTAGFLGDDNYTDFIFTLSYYWKKAYPEKSNPPSNNSLNHIAIKWESDFYDDNGAVIVEKDFNKVKLFQQPRDGTDEPSSPWWSDDSEFELDVYHLDIYDPVTIHVAEGSLIPDLPSAKDIVVPAIFLDWLYYKKNLSEVGTVAHTALVVAGLVSGIGEFYLATSWTLRIISGVQVLVTAGDLVIMNQAAHDAIVAQFDTDSAGEAFISLYQDISMAINMTCLARSIITSFEGNCAQYVTKFDSQEADLSVALGSTSDEFKALKTLRNKIGSVHVSTSWLDNLGSVLGQEAKWNIQAWINNGLDAGKTELAFANATDKLALFNNLKGAKSVYAQRIIIKDLNNIPGITHAPYVNNSLPEQTISANMFGENNAAYDLPSFRAPAFTESAELVTLPENTLLYRVTDEGGEAGAWWTLQPPSSLSEVIGGTAVMPKWNGFSKVVEYKVPAGGIKVWKGKAAAQPISDLPAYQSSTESLMGGSQQIFMNDVIRNDANFERYWRDVTQTYKTW